MAWPETQSNSLDDPPCACGNDLGGTGVAPVYVPNSGGLAQPTNLVAIAVPIPAPAETIMLSRYGGAVARVRLTPPGWHVMYDAFGGGSQFHLDAQLLTDDEAQVGSFKELPDFDVAADPRAVLLRHYWSQLGHHVEPIAVRRSGPVAVVGRIAFVRVGSRWFDGGNVHSRLGTTTVLMQGERVRFLDPHAMSQEFSGIRLPDGTMRPAI